MMKIGVSHYKDLKGNFYVNGGSLLLCDDEIVLKWVWKRIASFDRRTLEVDVLPNHLMYKVVKMSDGKESFEIMLTKKNFDKLISNYVGKEQIL